MGEIDGLPLHVLVVHLAVVLVPTAAFAVLRDRVGDSGARSVWEGRVP